MTVLYLPGVDVRRDQVWKTILARLVVIQSEWIYDHYSMSGGHFCRRKTQGEEESEAAREVARDLSLPHLSQYIGVSCPHNLGSEVLLGFIAHPLRPLQGDERK